MTADSNSKTTPVRMQAKGHRYYEANAAKCRELAKRAFDPAAQQRWLRMAEFWLQQGKGKPERDQEASATADVVAL